MRLNHENSNLGPFLNRHAIRDSRGFKEFALYVSFTTRHCIERTNVSPSTFIRLEPMTESLYGFKGAGFTLVILEDLTMMFIHINVEKLEETSSLVVLIPC